MLSSVNDATRGVGIGREPNVESREPDEAEGRDDLVAGSSYAFMVSVRSGRSRVATMPSTMYCATKGVEWWTSEKIPGTNAWRRPTEHTEKLQTPTRTFEIWRGGDNGVPRAWGAGQVGTAMGILI